MVSRKTKQSLKVFESIIESNLSAVFRGIALVSKTNIYFPYS